jgi:hypothetical protein
MLKREAQQAELSKNSALSTHAAVRTRSTASLLWSNKRSSDQSREAAFVAAIHLVSFRVVNRVYLSNVRASIIVDSLA